MKCPQCGLENSKQASFCVDCGASLNAPAAPPPPQQVVQPKPEKKRRLNPLLLVLLLLLMLVFCCCLLLTLDMVKPPAAVAPFVNRFIDPVRKILPAIPGINRNDGNGRGSGEYAPITCADFSGRLGSANLGQNTACQKDGNECYTDIHGVNDLKDISVIFSWDNGNQRTASCEQLGTLTRCYFSRDHMADRVNFWVALDECLQEAGYSDGWLDDSGEEKAEVGGEVVTAPQPSAPCCEILDISAAKYYRDPPRVGRLILYFEVRFDDCKPISGDDTLSGKVYVGPKQEEFWTDVECFDDLDGDDYFPCESPGNIDQKKSKSRLVLESGSCESEALFQSPYYAPIVPEEEEESASECPDGESMCEGSCCTIGHCCNCGSGRGCQSDCSDPTCF